MEIKHPEDPQGPMGRIRKSLTFVLSQERLRRGGKSGAERVFDSIMAQNLSNLAKDVNLQIEEFRES